MKINVSPEPALLGAAKKCAIAVSLVAFVVSLAAAQTNTSPSSGNAGVRPASYECEGNACSVVTLTWEEDGQRFRVENSSERRVKIDVATFEGSSSVIVEPHKSDYLQVKYFNGPYHANHE